MQPPPAPPQPPEVENAHRRASSTCSTKPRKSVGCMAGLLRLISPYHRSHHRKRLTAKNAAPPASPPPPPSTPPKKKAAAPRSTSPVKPMSPSPSPVKPAQQPQPPAAVRRRRSCDAPRSPTIAPEHRRASCDSPRPPPPAIVARLMGLEESAPSSPAAAPRALPTRPPPPPPATETAAEKRRKLLGALEKCDEDLKTLRRIIAAVRAAEMRAAAASDAPVAGTPPGKAGAKWTDVRDEQSPSPSPSPPQQQHKPRAEEQFPSPDSVLDAISSPRFPCRKRPSPCTNHDAGSKASCGNGTVAPTVGSKIVKPSRTFVFSGDYGKPKPGDELQLHLHAVGNVYRDPVPPPVVAVEAASRPARLPRAAVAESWRHHRRRWELEAAAAGRVISRAMVESVGDVWGHGAAGEQRREAAMVGAALERAILQDLVADVVAELLAQFGHGHGGGCRKRLCFG
ncbi:hypothetical protein ACP70R_016584 [Stipagrostis hirtigluma subsp. patula]